MSSVNSAQPRRILFVCLGNICRSPSAEGICRAAIEGSDLASLIETDSAGTGGWHQGDSPDPRAVEACARRGVDISDLRARQVTARDFETFDRIIAMDHSNHANLLRLAPKGTQMAQGSQATLSMMLSFAPGTGHEEVPDPYYGGPQGFEVMLDLLSASISALLDAEREALGLA